MALILILVFIKIMSIQTTPSIPRPSSSYLFTTRHSTIITNTDILQLQPSISSYKPAMAFSNVVASKQIASNVSMNSSLSISPCVMILSTASLSGFNNTNDQNITNISTGNSVPNGLVTFFNAKKASFCRSNIKTTYFHVEKTLRAYG